MKITILALGSNGDVTPCAALGGALARRGHQVRLASHSDFADLAQVNHLAFSAVAPPAQFMVARAGIRLDRLIAQFVDLATEFARGFSAPELRDADLILNQLPGGLYGWDLAEKTRIPMVALAYLPIIPTAAFAAIGWPSLPWSAYNRFTYRFAETLVWNSFRRPINRWRQETLGLPPQPREGNFHRLGTAAAPWMLGFSRALIPPPPDWGPHVRVTGYWHPPAGDWQPPEDLQRFLDQGEPPVFIGFGSMTMSDPARTNRIVVEALRISGLRAVLHAGWAGFGQARDNVGFQEPGIFPIHYAPYTELFQRVSGLVIHGGAGSVHCAARAGTPTLVVPFLYDQFGWGKRIHRLGAGPTPLPFKQLTAQRLAERLHDLVENPTYKSGAAALGQRIQPEDGLACAVQIIEEIA